MSPARPPERGSAPARRAVAQRQVCAARPDREANAALARAYLAALESGDLDRLFALTTDDAVFYVPDGGPFNRRELRAIFEHINTKFAAFPHFEIVGMTVEGDRVAVEAHAVARMKSGGVYENDYHFAFVVAGARMRYVREYADAAPARRHFFDDSTAG